MSPFLALSALLGLLGLIQQKKDILLKDVLFYKSGDANTPTQSLQYQRPMIDEGELTAYTKKREPQLLEVLFVKVAMTYSPTNLCSTIGAVGLNFSVRDGKRWIPDAINRLNKGLIP